MDYKRIRNIFLHSGDWEIILSETKFKCGSITNCPAPAKNALDLGGNVWIVSVKNGGFLKMVKLKVTGENSYNHIETKANPDGNYNEALCVSSFSESECFKHNPEWGNSFGGSPYQIDLKARKKSTSDTQQGKVMFI